MALFLKSKYSDVIIQKRIESFLLTEFALLLALLFSATFRKKIEKLARDILIDPIRVVQGDIGEVKLSRAGYGTHTPHLQKPHPR